MRKIYTLFILLAAAVTNVSAQNDTIYFEDFEDSVYVTVGTPPGISGDTTLYDFDGDGNADASGSNRPDEWFLTEAFSMQDAGNTVLVSNSWTNPATAVDNYLITGSINVTDTTFRLSWKSAPFQTPLYVDGYSVRVSTATNDPYSFNDTLFTAAEYISRQSSLPDTAYSRFTFSPGFVHGQDGQFIEYENDSLRFRGVLQPFSVSLRNYVGMNIYVAFVHNATDDNLISIDDILVTGNRTTGVAKNSMMDGEWSLYPNPVKERTTLAYTLVKESSVRVMVCNMAGQLISSENKGFQLKGKHSSILNVQHLFAGEYNVVIETSYGRKVQKMIVTK